MKSWIVIAALLVAACDPAEKPSGGGEPATSAVDFDTLSKDAYEYLHAQQAAVAEEFQLGSYERYDWDQETKQLVWSDAGVPKVIADIQFVGSISHASHTWLWSWANSSVSEELSRGMQAVRDHGEAHGREKLIDAKWPAEEVDGWEMTAIAAYLLKAKGAYRSPGDTGFTFMVFTDVRFAENEGQEEPASPES